MYGLVRPNPMNGEKQIAKLQMDRLSLRNNQLQVQDLRKMTPSF